MKITCQCITITSATHTSVRGRDGQRQLAPVEGGQMASDATWGCSRGECAEIDGINRDSPNFDKFSQPVQTVNQASNIRTGERC